MQFNDRESLDMTKYDCVPCGKSYIGETAKNLKTRHTEHMKAAETGNHKYSGLTQHMAKCDGKIEGPHILYTTNGKNKNALKHELRVMEALNIRRYDCGPYRGMNEDMGFYVKTTQWDPVFGTMRGQE